ncbi:MAG: hypothetical protein ACJ763_08360 [Bdellovibrionia bacterium]
MIHAMGWLVKITLFSIFILVLGNWIQWNGRSVSDQVKTQISHAERSDFANSIRRWTGNVAHDVRNGAAHKSVRHKNESRPKEVASQETSSEETNEAPADVQPMEKIHSSERQKLRALIQELNTSTSADRRGTH